VASWSGHNAITPAAARMTTTIVHRISDRTGPLRSLTQCPSRIAGRPKALLAEIVRCFLPGAKAAR
jgi:hypothetical protein